MKNKQFPDMYAKSIISINYDKLLKLGIKTILFDLDNTIVEPGHKIITKELKELFNKLKKDFNCIVLSNTIKAKKINNFCNQLDVKYIYFALKPLPFGYIRAKKLHSSKPNEIVMVGDQYFTDVVGAKKMGYFTILVDQVGPNEGIFTKINRKRENKKYKELNFKKGNYYD